MGTKFLFAIYFSFISIGIFAQKKYDLYYSFGQNIISKENDKFDDVKFTSGIYHEFGFDYTISSNKAISIFIGLNYFLLKASLDDKKLYSYFGIETGNTNYSGNFAGLSIGVMNNISITNTWKLHPIFKVILSKNFGEKFENKFPEGFNIYFNQQDVRSKDFNILKKIFLTEDIGIRISKDCGQYSLFLEPKFSFSVFQAVNQYYSLRFGTGVGLIF